MGKYTGDLYENHSSCRLLFWRSIRFVVDGRTGVSIGRTSDLENTASFIEITRGEESCDEINVKLCRDENPKANSIVVVRRVVFTFLGGV